MPLKKEGVSYMLAKFNNEVLKYGPDAVLPQNLNKEWLDTLQKMAEDFLEANYDPEQCKKPENIVDPILSVCVSEILRYLNIVTKRRFPMKTY